MGNRKFNDDQKEEMRNTFGYDDEQFKIIEENPKLFDLMDKTPILHSKKMVAT